MRFAQNLHLLLITIYTLMKKIIPVLIGLISLSITSNAQSNRDEARKERIREILEEKLAVPIDQLHLLKDMKREEASTGSQKEKTAITSEKKISNVNSSGVDEGEGYIAVDPNDSNHLVLSYMDFRNTQPALRFPIYYSTDGGQNWTLSNFKTEDVFDLDYPSQVIGGGGDPVFAFDSNGKIYFSWIYLGIDFGNDVASFTMNWAYSTDGGVTWQVENGSDHFIGYGTLDNISSGGQVGSTGDGIFDRQWMDVDRSGGPNDGRLYTSTVFFPGGGTQLNGDGIVIRYKDANSNTFAVPNYPVSNEPSTQFGNVRVDNTGKVHVTYADLSAAEVKHLTSTNGQTFGNKQTVAIGTQFFPTPSPIHDRSNAACNLAVDLSDNSLYLTYSDFTPNGVKGYVVVSNDAGNTWGTPVDIGTLGTGNQALMPTVDAHNGNVSISWFDVGNSNHGTQYSVQSIDKGASWLTPRAVSTDSTNFNLMSTSWFGDYFTTARTNCHTYTIWSDGRNIGTKIYVGKVDNCQEISVPEFGPLNTGIRLEGLYPNPATDHFEIELSLTGSSTFEINLLDLSGRKISNLKKTESLSGKQKISVELPELSEELYLVEIVTEDGIFVRKLYVK